MSLEGIRAVSSYQSTQAVAASAPTPSVSAAAAVKTASVSDTIKKKTVYEGEEGSSYAQEEASKKPVSTADLQRTVDRLNNEMNKTECRYSLHEATNRVMISIVDKETKEVIKEFPVEEALDRISKALELAGLIVDEKL